MLGESRRKGRKLFLGSSIQPLLKNISAPATVMKALQL